MRAAVLVVLLWVCSVNVEALTRCLMTNSPDDKEQIIGRAMLQRKYQFEFASTLATIENDKMEYLFGYCDIIVVLSHQLLVDGLITAYGRSPAYGFSGGQMQHLLKGTTPDAMSDQVKAKYATFQERVTKPKYILITCHAATKVGRIGWGKLRDRIYPVRNTFVYSGFYNGAAGFYVLGGTDSAPEFPECLATATGAGLAADSEAALVALSRDCHARWLARKAAGTIGTMQFARLPIDMNDLPTADVVDIAGAYAFRQVHGGARKHVRAARTQHRHRAQQVL